MAEITELEPQPKIAKFSEIQAKAEEIKQQRELPPKPGMNVTFVELKQWLSLLPDTAEDRVSIWVYRLDPLINRQLVNPDADNNIDSIYRDFKSLDEEYFISRHGGGSYRLIVKDEDKGKPMKGGFFQATLYIPMMIHPPKLNLREVVWTEPKNKGFRSWAIAQRLITEDNVPVIERKEESKTNGAIAGDAATLKLLLDFASQMSTREQNAFKQKLGGEDAITKSMGDLMLEKMKQDDPNKSAATMIQMITAIKGMNPEPKQDNTMALMMPLLIKMMDDSRAAADRQMTMILEMFKNNQPVAKDEVDELDKLQKLLAIAKEIKGGGGSTAEKTMTESLIELGRDVLPSALTLFGNIMAMNAAAKGVAGIQPMPSVPPTNAVDVKQGPTNFATLHEQNTMNYKPQPSQPQPTGLPAPSEIANFIQQFEPVIINKLAGEGWEFAAWVAEGFPQGDMIVASVVKNGPEALMQAAKSVPSFWQKIETTYGEAHLQKWLQSLCNYKEILQQMEAEGGEEK